MNKATEKLINYLTETSQRKKEKIIDIITNDIPEKQIEKKSLVRSTSDVIYSENIVKLLQTDSKDYAQQKIIFTDFKILSEFLTESNLNNREKFSIIIEILEKNISTGILESESMGPIDILDLDKIDRKKINLTVNEYVHLQDVRYINEMLTKPEEELTEREIKIKEELQSAIGISVEHENMKRITTNTRIIKEHLIDRTNNYTEDDIKKIITALKNLEVTEDMCDCIKHVLERNLEKRIDKETPKKTTYNLYSQQEHSNKYITDKEYKQMKKELKNYFDFYNMKPIRELTQEEIMYCASLALKLNIDKSTVRLFFIIMEKQNTNDNPITEYNQNYGKIKYYEEKFELKESVDIINEAIKECFITSKEDYIVWKEMIKLELDSINKKLPKNYEYELEKASGNIQMSAKTLKK